MRRIHCSPILTRLRRGEHAHKLASLLFVLALAVSPLQAATLSVNKADPLAFQTIQACANSAKAGDTCAVSAGDYPEFVLTANSGTADKKIIFQALGKVVVKGFRIMHPHTTLDGFEITKLATGANPGSITIEPEGDYCTITNNTIRDGVYLHSHSFVFDAATKTITNPSGGFLAAGFEPGSRIYIASNINNLILNHDTLKTIKIPTDGSKSVLDTKITLSDTDTLLSEGPVLSFIYAVVAGNFRDGVMGIAFNLSSTRGAAEHCTIRANRLSNLGGKAMYITGAHHLIERNIIERVNGWEVFFLVGHDNTFRYNYIKDSDRPEGFEVPDGSLDQTTGKYWDFVHPIMTMFGSSSIESGNNVFEYNFIENMVSEFVNINAKHPVQIALPSRRFIFRHNVVAGLERHGAFHIPEAIITNNTFYRAAYGSSTRGVFSVAGVALGSADGSIIKNNVFVDCNVGATDTTGQQGWYSTQDVVMGEAPNFNFVAGPGPAFSKKAAFEGAELNGINGGDPLFRNVANLVGSDGIPFTADDGLIPQSQTRLCSGGENRSHIGAYPCLSAGILPMPPSNLKIQ